MRVRTQHRVVVPLSPAELWTDVVDATSYEKWWPWLQVRGADEMRTGSHLSVTIPSPLGYRVRIVLAPTVVHSNERLEAAVTGDLEGAGAVVLRGDGDDRTLLELRWDVEVVRPLLRALGVVMRPLLHWGHRRVVERAIEDFLRRR